MPIPMLKSLYARAKKHKPSLTMKKVEEHWEEAKKIAAEKFNKTDASFFPYVTGILKRSLGLTSVKAEVVARIRYYLLANDRQKELGPCITATGYKDSFVVIYRAMNANTTTFTDYDYVTRSQKFAIEHCDHMTTTEEEPFHVVKAMVRAEHVFNASNPGEYFYHGPNKVGKVIYASKLDD